MINSELLKPKILKPILEDMINKKYVIGKDNPFKEIEILIAAKVYDEYLEESDDREQWKQYEVALENDYAMYVVTVKDKISCVNLYNDKSEMVLGHNITEDKTKFYFSEIYNEEWLDYLG
ncbi:MAG: hypothetical protein ACOCQR_02960 [bacterium]